MMKSQRISLSSLGLVHHAGYGIGSLRFEYSLAKLRLLIAVRG